ncbi:transposable element Tcb1 transposase [Trichonephila clavipes]|nr:transposable element Tcb1 transposase [Trichonephila clavipes]
MWCMVAQRLTRITPPAATPDQLWQRVEAAWSAVPQEHIQSLFESMPRRVAASHGKIVEVEIGGVAIYRPFGEFRRANSYCHLYGAQGLGQLQAYF